MNRNLKFIKVALVLGIAWTLLGCDSGNLKQLAVEPVWDRQAGFSSHMMLSDRRYAVQAVGKDGRPLYFVEIGPLLFWLKDQSDPSQYRLWVRDMKADQWIEAHQAHWIQNLTDSPMDHGFGALGKPFEGALDFESVGKRVLAKGARSRGARPPRLRTQ